MTNRVVNLSLIAALGMVGVAQASPLVIVCAVEADLSRRALRGRDAQNRGVATSDALTLARLRIRQLTPEL
jgi:hypothetical protein